MSVNLKRKSRCSKEQKIGMMEAGKKNGFGRGLMSLGEIEVAQMSTLKQVWADESGACFYKPVQLPKGFHSVGYYAQLNNRAVDGSVLVVKNAAASTRSSTSPAALAPPVDYTLVWSSREALQGPKSDGNEAWFWLPVALQGYRALGYVVSNTKEKPVPEEVVCAREDLTAECSIGKSLCSTAATTTTTLLSWWPWRRNRRTSSPGFYAWTTQPLKRAVEDRGLAMGTFHCSSSCLVKGAAIAGISTLQNVELNLDAMPNLQQVEEIVSKYAPTVMFHPDEAYFPSSVPWFFQQGALLYSKQDRSNPTPVAPDGSNLPAGGSNDGQYWLDLPSTSSAANRVTQGDLSSAKAYLHVKPMHGGSFTDLQFWIFYPFNGPATLKVGAITLKLGKIGQHVSDWEHLTLRVNNLDATLSRVYLAHHSSGTWFQPSDLEYNNKDNNRAVVYAGKHGHAAYPHQGDNLQGDEKLGIGILNVTKRSNMGLDISTKYELISAGYLGTEEPHWLQYMREWGPKVEYNSRSELDKIIKVFPKKIRRSVEDLFDKFPGELSGEEGPTGPKEKNYWLGDER